MILTLKESELLREISQSKRFPIVRFELKSSKESDLISTALNHVRITNADDNMDEVKKLSSVLSKLQEEGLININYNIFLTARSDYQVYYESKIYAMLCELAEESKNRPDFLFDTPFIKKGAVTLSDKGLSIVNSL